MLDLKLSGGTVVDGVRPGVVEVEGGAAREAAAQRECERVEGSGAGVHPCWHGATLEREERVTAVSRDLIATDAVWRIQPRAFRVAIERVQTVEIT